MSTDELYGETTVPVSTMPGVNDVNVVVAAGATESLDATGYSCHDITLDQNCTLIFASPYTSGHLCSFILILRQNAIGGHITTWPLSVDWAGGAPPAFPTTLSSRSDFEFYTTNGGIVWAGKLLGADIK